MEQMIPGFLEEMLKKQYGEEAFAKILAGYQARRPVTLRVNPLKADRNSVEQALTGAGIAFKNVSWYEDAMIIEGAREPEIQELPIYKEGGIYLQSLSSMLPPLFLGPKAGESVLDMAAAPGGKTTQMAAMTGNQAQITACEKNKARSEKLKYNLEKQGASGTYVMVEDARKLDDFFSFDRILLDAPCSGSGTVEVRDGVCRTKISKELVERSARTQEELLKKGYAYPIIKNPQYTYEKRMEEAYNATNVIAKDTEEESHSPAFQGPLYFGIAFLLWGSIIFGYFNKKKKAKKGNINKI